MNVKWIYIWKDHRNARGIVIYANHNNHTGHQPLSALVKLLLEQKSTAAFKTNQIYLCSIFLCHLLLSHSTILKHKELDTGSIKTTHKQQHTIKMPIRKKHTSLMPAQSFESWRPFQQICFPDVCFHADLLPASRWHPVASLLGKHNCLLGKGFLISGW